MRVIAGLLRGRRIRAPRGHRVRPTADRVRESVFNILGERVRDARVLDLFAGSGALGIEALSRGAAEAVFVEQDASTARIIVENLESVGCGSRARVVRGAVDRILPRLAGPFDLVFADPPYGRDLALEVLEVIGRGELLANDGEVVLEHARHDPVPEEAGRLALIDRRRFGETLVSFYGRRG